MELFDYGINEDRSDIRAHVGPLSCTVYVFPTRLMRRLLRDSDQDFKLRKAFQPGVSGATAEGYLVPISCIPKLKKIELDPYYFEEFDAKMSESEKGRKAERLVSLLIRKGEFPLSCVPSRNEDLDLQMKGQDIIVRARIVIQVKHDRRAGPKHIPGCSGNLYIQIRERNPGHKH